MELLTVHGATYASNDPRLEWNCERCRTLWPVTAEHVLVGHPEPRPFGHCETCRCPRAACPGSGKAPGASIRLSVPGDQPLYGDTMSRRWFSLVDDPIVAGAS